MPPSVTVTDSAAGTTTVRRISSLRSRSWRAPPLPGGSSICAVSVFSVTPASDLDAHHGDGVQAAFWDDPRVLTISVHEHPDTLFPGTGRPGETGGPHADGSAVNVALPAGTGDAGWLRAFHAVVPPIVRSFGPQLLVSQHGCDSHRDDPLTNLALSIDGQRAAHAAIHALAHQASGGCWLLTGGGGYDHVHVVPRTWTHLLFEAAARRSTRPWPPRNCGANTSRGRPARPRLNG